MARVLIAELGQRTTVSVLLEETFTVFTAGDREEAMHTVMSLQPDLVVLEVGVPDEGAIQVCSAIRALTASPIVLMSGPCSERAVLSAFAAGADSVVAGLVGPHELVARIRALLRRAPPKSTEEGDVLVVGPIRLDRARREVTVNGELIAVPRREFDIAELLMRDVGRVVPRVVIVRELWGSMRDTKSLDVQVGRLRARLAAAEGRRRIVTVRGVGFRFLGDDEPYDTDPSVGDIPVGDLVNEASVALELEHLDLVGDDLEEPASA